MYTAAAVELDSSTGLDKWATGHIESIRYIMSAHGILKGEEACHKEVKRSVLTAALYASSM